MSNLDKKITVVGGGTAGWIAALMTRKSIPDAQITVIASEEMGVLGAGEGTVPHFIQVCDFLDIPFSELVTHADATVKSGIKFTAWNDPNDKSDFYFHNFGVHYRDQMGEFDGPYARYSASNLLSVEAELPGSSADFMSAANHAHKVPFVLKEELKGDYNPILSYENLANFAVHFNAVKLAEFFKKVALSRGVTYIDDKVIDFNKDPNTDDIVEVHTEKNGKIACDFIFDCSGFRRLILGKTYNTSWVDYSKYLPVNKALPFFLKLEESIPPYTEAIAMKYGWMWKIPTGERYGCGYVFDSALVSDEDAQKEVEEYFGQPVEIPRTFSFSPGRFENMWVNNCVAVGLAGSFIEPLEATSIWFSSLTVEEVLQDVSGMFNRSAEHVASVNKRLSHFNDCILAFVYYHYMGKRDDSEFWASFKDVSNAPPLVQDVLKAWEHTLPTYHQFESDIFKEASWFSVGRGLGLLNTQLIKEAVRHNYLLDVLDMYTKDVASFPNVIDELSGHRDFLQELKGSTRWESTDGA